mgnify:CR=1 FL=1
MWLPRKLNLKGLTFKLLYVVYSFYSNGNFQRKCVRPLEVKFPKSHILLVHSMLPNCGFSIVRKKGKILYPRCSLGACLRCDKHLKYSDYRADGIYYFFLFSSIPNLQIRIAFLLPKVYKYFILCDLN